MELSSSFYDHFNERSFIKGFLNDSLKMCLVDNYIFNPSETLYSQVLPFEISSSNYVSGGNGILLTSTLSNQGYTELTFTDTVFLGPLTSSSAIVYSETSGDLILHLDFGQQFFVEQEHQLLISNNTKVKYKINSPESPAVFQATNVDTNQVSLGWEKPFNSIAISKFEIDRKIDSGLFQRTEISSQSSSFQYTDNPSTSDIYFRIRSVISSEISSSWFPNENGLRVSTLGPKPLQLFEYDIVNQIYLILSWSFDEQNVGTSYCEIHSSSNGVDFFPFENVLFPTSSFDFQNLELSTDYYLKARTVDQKNAISSWSNIIQYTTPDIVSASMFFDNTVSTYKSQDFHLWAGGESTIISVEDVSSAIETENNSTVETVAETQTESISETSSYLKSGDISYILPTNFNLSVEDVSSAIETENNSTVETVAETQTESISETSSYLKPGDVHFSGSA